jgi:FMN phosphatase YigB (HAD superfamily)
METKYFLFDFDGTIVSTLDINYVEMKSKIKKILEYTEDLSPMIDIINCVCKNDEKKRKLCFDIMDEYELKSILNCNINQHILNLYINSNPKIIISRNGEIPIRHFFLLNNIPGPDFISCRDNCTKLKPDKEQFDIIVNNYDFLKKENVTIVGDSWHDQLLSKNIGCEFYTPFNIETAFTEES